MSKNISIRDGSQSRYFTASKLRTNLQGGSTCDWVPIDEVDQYVELEELHVTENGTYYPSEKVGISAVYVDVPQEGSSVVPSGVSVRATAAEDLTAGDCVYIISGGSGGTAGQAPCVLNGQTISSLASGGGYVYYKGDNTTIKRIPISDLTATPENYKSNLTSIGTMFTRNLISYNDGTATLENVKTGAKLYGYNTGDTRTSGSKISQHHFHLTAPTGGFYGINDLQFAFADFYGMSYCTLLISPNEYVAVGDGTSYTHYKNGTANTIAINKPIKSFTALYDAGIYMNVINNKLVGVTRDANSNSKYELIYYDLNADDGVAHNLKDKNNNNIECATNKIGVKYNADNNILFIMAGSGTGLVMVKENLSTAIYDNISGISGVSEMFGNYFFDAALKQTFFVPQESIMGKTNAKAHEGSLGFVGADVAAGTVGVATEMFR